MVAGAVWVTRTTPTHITAKAVAMSAKTTAFGMKCSLNSHTLRAMLTSGSMMTRNGWELRSGPACSAALLQHDAGRAADREGVDRPVQEHSAHPELGERDRHGLDEHRYERPHDGGGRSVQGGARAGGSPLRQDRQDGSGGAVGRGGCDPVLTGGCRPPRGSPATRNTARPAQVRAAPHQAARRIDWSIQNLRSTSPKMSSVTKSGCTTEIWPLCRARAWKMNAPASATHPKSHRGLRNK